MATRAHDEIPQPTDQEKKYVHWLSTATPTPVQLGAAVLEWLVARGCPRDNIRSVTASFVRDVPEHWGVERRAAVHVEMHREGDTKLQEPSSRGSQHITLTNSHPSRVNHGCVQRLVVTPIDDDESDIAILSIAVTCGNTHLVLVPAPSRVTLVD